MNFCSNCGSNNIKNEIPLNDHRLRNVCHDCDSIFYENPRIVVGTVPVYNNKVLLAKRGIEPQLGKWNLPAGFLEIGESIETGSIRETIEETGAELSDISLQSMYHSSSNHLYVFFLAELKSDRYNTTPESTEIMFFDFEDIPWDDIAFSANTYALKKLIDNSHPTNNFHFKSEEF